MRTDQYALYRVDLNTAGKDLWKKTYDQLKSENRQIRIDFYRQIHISNLSAREAIMDIWERTADIRDVSDVIVVNRDGEVSCFYVDENTPRRISGFIRINSSGALVTLDTKDYRIDGMEGNWLAADEIIIDGRQFFLMEHQDYHRQTTRVILDCYGKKIMEECGNGFDQQTKEILHGYVRNNQIKEPDAIEKQNKPDRLKRLELWQKAYENGHYERSWESGMEVNYDAIDGCVNHQKDHPGKALPDPEKKPKKRISVIKRLREKQIAIAKRSGKPLPKYLEQQMVREKI